MITRLFAIVLFTFSAGVAAAQQYHLELEATPEAVFPYLGRFGNVELHVYKGGVRAEALWLNAISRNDAEAVTVMNPLGRMYVDVPVGDIAAILHGFAGADGIAEQLAAPLLGDVIEGGVKGVGATRNRFIYGNDAWIVIWTTNVIPENAQMRRIVSQVVSGLSPHTAKLFDKIPGTPLYVEMNFRRFKKVVLVRMKSLTYTADDEEEALTRGPVYVRATVLEKIFTPTKK